MNRRGFLQSIIALGAAPAIVKAESIMRVAPIILPPPRDFITINLGVGVAENAVFSCWVKDAMGNYTRFIEHLAPGQQEVQIPSILTNPTGIQVEQGPLATVYLPTLTQDTFIEKPAMNLAHFWKVK